MVQTFLFADDGVVPNNPVLPVVVIPAAIKANPSLIEERYVKNGWAGAWVYSVFDYLHYHPDAHEVLTCIGGWGDVQIGGLDGRNFRMVPGDTVVLPAGTGHCLFDSDKDFLVVGAYPRGQEAPEIRPASLDTHEGTPARVAAVSLPKSCPIYGTYGPTMQAWTGFGN